MGTSWRIRNYSPGDEVGLERLFLACNRQASIAKWRWIQANNPLGSRMTEGDVLVAEAGGKIVGHYAKIRYSMHWFGETCMGAQGWMLATHPDFRRKGIASELIETSRGDSKSLGIKVHFSFPNQSSASLSQKAGVIYKRDSAEFHLILDRRAYFK